MDLKINEVYNAKVLVIKGKLMGGIDAELFHDALQNSLNERIKNVIVDMSGIKFVNSSGIGILVRGLTTLKNAGGELKLAGIPDKVQGVLSITKLTSVFDIKASVEEASKTF